jgi:hypothetical protein
MTRGALRVAVLAASVALFGGLTLHDRLVQAHGPGGSCQGYCQDQGRADFAAPTSYPDHQQQPYPQPAYPIPSAYYGQGLRTFANLAAESCPHCRAEREPGTTVDASNFAARPAGVDASWDRPRLPPLTMPSRPAGYPLMHPDAHGMQPRLSPEYAPYLAGQPSSVHRMPAGSKRGRPARGSTASSVSVPQGMALVLQNDTPLMHGSEQLGSIDRDQTLRVLDVRGNWVQLETNWLGKNTWLRRDQIHMNDNIRLSNDIAPPAT